MPVRTPRLRAATAALAVLLGMMAATVLALAPAASARASLGSVPVVVSDYVSGGALVARLEELYGPGKKKGTGVDFDATTKPGPISRVYEWTDDRYAHADSAHPIQLTNYWTVPITIADKPVGVAAIWINPQSDAPELAQFTASTPLATALAAVPADAALVHDAATSAWYGVAGGTATPLIEGRSGVTTPTAVKDLALTRTATSAPAAGGDPNTGIGIAIGVLALLVLVIVAVLVLPGRLRRVGEKPADAAADAAAEADAAAVIEPATTVAEPTPEPEPTPAAKPRTTAPTPRTTAPRTTAPRAPASKTTAPKAAAAKPRTPVSQKPATSKPGGTRPAASKPATSKPAASKSPAPRSRPRKPDEGDTPAGDAATS